jgi:transcriptional regulator with XRE-family HTH domain
VADVGVAQDGVGARLRASRERLGLSRTELAGLVGCSPAALGGIESGYNPRRSRVLSRAWEVLDALQSEAQSSGQEAGEASAA